MTHITITKHAIQKTEQRTRHKWESAKYFLINIFNKLSEKSRKWLKNKGREVKYWYLGNNRYEIGDWKHKIVYVKNRETNEAIILTYINNEDKSEDYNMKQLLHELGLLGANI